MPIRIKIAQTAKELTDVYKLRHQVYVDEEQNRQPQPGGLIVNHFDNVPGVVNLVAYNAGKAIGTIRLNMDSGILLPADEIFDFGPYRERINQQIHNHSQPALFCCSSMLAITKQWRGRRGIFRALFKLGCDILHSWGVTHMISAVNEKTLGLYQHLEFEALAEKQFCPQVNEDLTPMGNELPPIYRWAFGTFDNECRLLENFSGCFEYLLADTGTEIFAQGTKGEEAYLVSKGRVTISQTDPDLEESLNLEILGEGDMFGELSLIDRQPRAGTATAMCKTELIVLNRNKFWHKTEEDTDYIKGLLQIMTKRLRDVGQRAFIYAHGSVDTRLKFFANLILEQAKPSKETPDDHIAWVTLDEFAHLASVPHEEAAHFLLALQLDKRLSITKDSIVFHGDGEI